MLELLEHHLLFDSKTLRTLYALMLKPGHLTRAYIDGRRMRYLPPLRLYLYMSFLFFIALHFSGLAAFQVVRQVEPAAQSGADGAGGADRSHEDGGNHIEFQILQPPKEGNWSLSESKYIKAGVKLDPDDAKDLDEAEKFIGATPSTDKDQPAESALDAWGKRILKGGIMAMNHPRLLNEVLDTWVPRLLILLLPFIALWLALFGLGRRMFYVDHLAFALHGQSFAFLLATVAVGLELIWPGLKIYGWLFLAAMVWTVLAYRHVYRSGWFWTVFKIGFIGSVYFFWLVTDLTLAVMWGVSEIPF